jgi:hypothetical protein
MFLPIIKTINKNNKIIEDAMDFMNTSLFEIDNNKTKSHENTWLTRSQVFEREKKKAYKMNTNVINIWSNFNPATCHVFITSQSQMPPPINMFESSSNDSALLNNQNTNEN